MRSKLFRKKGIRIPWGIKKLSANQFPVWTCLFLMKFKHLLVPPPPISFCVWEYNYTQNAYSSFCLPAAYSVRFIRPWSGRDEEPVSVSICQCAWLSVCLLLRLSWIRHQVTQWPADHHLFNFNDASCVNGSKRSCKLWIFLNSVDKNLLNKCWFLCYCKKQKKISKQKMSI